MTDKIVVTRDRAMQAVRELLWYVDPSPQRPGLRDTPERFVKAMEEFTSGYEVDPATVLKVFEDGAEGSAEMITIGPIPFFSLCEHHLAPFFGEIHVCYIPNGKIIGLSKAARLAEIFARRLQVQERLTNQIADALYDNEALRCLGVGVMVKARHMCMEARGVRCAGVFTTTTALRGVIFDDGPTRAEFLAAVRS